MSKSKKIDDKKKKVKPTQTKENKKPKESPNKKTKSEESLEKKVKPTQTKENKKPKESPNKKNKPEKSVEKNVISTPNKKNKPEESLEKKVILTQTKEESVIHQPQRKRSNSMDLFDKYGYDIYTENEKRQEALGNLVIAFGPTELIKKLDSENMKLPNMSHKFNDDKKWVRDNFKKY